MAETDVNIMQVDDWFAGQRRKYIVSVITLCAKRIALVDQRALAQHLADTTALYSIRIPITAVFNIQTDEV